MKVEGYLLQLTIEPFAGSLLGIDVMDSEIKTTGRYMSRPESVYGSIHCGGKSVLNIQELLDWIMTEKGSPAESIYVKLDGYVDKAFNRAEFTRVLPEEKS